MSVISESDPRTIRATAGSTYGPAVLGQGSVEGRTWRVPPQTAAPTYAVDPEQV
ncbi:hypothetical protein [Streptomyces sp. HSG2]|uniref:hypothetical protein n=1 Tax=Streptomyces sp. HSG2 TaxID=2797167 RepID=UPI0019081641|nr:hypothetical protein [Streptomyces sp. HSG2]